MWPVLQKSGTVSERGHLQMKDRAASCLGTSFFFLLSFRVVVSLVLRELSDRDIWLCEMSSDFMRIRDAC